MLRALLATVVAVALAIGCTSCAPIRPSALTAVDAEGQPLIVGNMQYLVSFWGAPSEDVDLHTAVVLVSDPDLAASAIGRGANADRLPRSLGEMVEDGAWETNPLRIACAWRDMDVACALIEAGADPNYLDSDGEPPIAYAARTTDIEWCQFLLDHGADINGQGEDGYTALEYEFLGGVDSNAESDHEIEEMMVFLLANGATIAPRTLTAAMDGAASDGYCKYELVRDVLERLLASGQKSRLTPVVEAAILGDSAEVATFVNSGNYESLSKEDRDLVLFYTVAQGDVSTLELLLSHGESTSACDADNNSLLAIAARSGNADTLACLIARGLSLESQNWNDYTPLHLAVACGQLETARMLLEAGATVDPGNSSVMLDMLGLASANGDLPMVKLVIDSGYPLAMIGTGVQAAAEYDQLEVLEYLMDLAGPADSTTRDEAALSTACLHGSMACVRYLVERGADVDGAPDGRGEPLNRACECGQAEVVAFLLEHGADVHAGDDPAAGTALSLAVTSGSAAIVELLLEHGADADETYDDGSSVLMNAVWSGSAADVECLLKHGADVNATDTFGWTPLIVAARNGDTEIVRLLLAYGADASVVDANGCTAATILKVRNSSEVEELLESAEGK